MEDVLGKRIKIHRTKIPAQSEDEEDKIIEEEEVMYEIIKTVKGQDLVGLAYDYILADEIPKQMEFDAEIEKVHTILPGDHVELGEGTGLVHTAPESSAKVPVLYTQHQDTVRTTLKSVTQTACQYSVL